MPQLLKNFAGTTISAPITTGAVSATVADGSKFPAMSAGDYFDAVIINPTDVTKREIVVVTARNGNTLTMVRAQEGTEPLAFPANSIIELRITAATMRKWRATEDPCADYGAIADGTLHTVQEWVTSGRFSGLAAIQVAYPHVTALTDSIDWAAVQAALNKVGGSVYCRAGVYVSNREFDRSKNASWIGDGVGHWRPGTFNDFSEYNLASGTNFLMAGTGPKTRTQDFITDCRCMGHVVTNPAPEVTVMDHADVSAGATMVASTAPGVPAGAPRSKVLFANRRDTGIFGFQQDCSVKSGDTVKVRLTAASSAATAGLSIGVSTKGGDKISNGWLPIAALSNTAGAWTTVEATWVVPAGYCFVSHWIQVNAADAAAPAQGWYVAECEMWVNGASVAADGEFALTDFTNQDAVGTTRATLKPFSAAVFSNSRQGGSMSGMRFVTNHPDGGETYGVGGYRNSSLTTMGDEWDVGLYNASTRSLRCDNVQFVGYWRIAGMLTVPLDYGQQRAGLSEMCKYRDSIFQGMRGVSFRDGDLSPVLAFNASTITTRWTKSHRYPSAGTLYVDGATWAYTSLSYDATNALLTFNGSSTPAGLVANKSLIQQTSSQGVANTTFDGCDITDLSHSSRICEYRPILGGLFSRPGSAIEISGRNLRGINFAFSSVYVNGPILGHLGRVRNVMFMGNHYEAKTNYKAVGVASGLTGATWIAGGAQANPDNVGDADIDDPDNLIGTRTVDVRFLGTSGNDMRVDKSPLIPCKSLSSRCRNWDLFNPNQFFDDTSDLQRTGALLPDQKKFMFPGGRVSYFTAEGYRRFTIGPDNLAIGAPVSYDVTPSHIWDNDRVANWTHRDPATKALTQKFTIDTAWTGKWGGNWNPGAGNAYKLGEASLRWSEMWVNVPHIVCVSSANSTTVPTVAGEVTVSRNGYTGLVFKMVDNVGVVRSVTLTLA